MIHALVRRLVLTACLLTIAPLLANAQPMGAQDDDFLYRVVKDDTLLELAERYTHSPNLWSFLRDHNAVDDPRALPIGKILRIPFRLIPERPSTARIVHIIGSVHANEQLLQVGRQLEEGHRLRTGPDSYVTLLLEDGSTMMLPGSSNIQVQRLRAFEGTGLIDAILSVENGALESIVAPEKNGVGRFEVRTPVTITGVRGTQLRVRSDDNGSQTEILDGQVQLQASAAAQTAVLRAGQGATTSPDGRMHAVQILPAAPTLSIPERTPQGWQVDVTPVPGAQVYLVRVASDPEGTRPWSAKLFDTPEAIHFSAPGAGTYYVLVRAVTASGLMGPDAAQPFEGRAVLISRDGQAIVTGYGGQVHLNDY